MSDALLTYLQDLEGGETLSVDASVAGSCLAADDAELSFPEQVKVTGQVYLAGDTVVACLSAATRACLPCRMCNGPAWVDLRLANTYHSWDRGVFKNGKVDCLEPVREELLLQVPQFAECHNGQCPERCASAAYFAKESTCMDGVEGYQPFSDLSLDLACSED
jgi:uncharacterized metal-binding protein YceD (DUF177 family)